MNCLLQIHCFNFARVKEGDLKGMELNRRIIRIITINILLYKRGLLFKMMIMGLLVQSNVDGWIM